MKFKYVEMGETMLFSLALTSALLGVLIAQLIKVPIYFVMYRKWNFGLMFSTGGMPSSHTAMVTALATSVGLTEGFDSVLFAISAVFAMIVIHDSTGVRRHAGYHAEVLNQLVRDFNIIMQGIKNPKVQNWESRQKLKELLGHKPIEVFFGGLLGAGLSVGLYFLYQ